MKSISDTIGSRLSISRILGISMLFAGLFYVFYSGLEKTQDLENILILASYIFLAAAGAVITFNKELSLNDCVSTAGFVIGVIFMLQYGLVMNAVSDFQFAISLIAIVVGAAMVFASVAYYFGYHYNAFRMTILMVVIVATDLVPAFVDWYEYIPLLDIIRDNSPLIPIYIVYGVFMYTLSRKEIRYRPVSSRISSNLDTIENMFHNDSGASISPADLKTMVDGDYRSWPHRTDGIIECETVMTIRNSGRTLDLVLQKWVDDPVLHALIVPEYGGQYIQGFRIDLCHVVVREDGASARIYGRDGMFIDILVSDPPEPKSRVQRIVMELESRMS